jgi:hypothetical protein
MNFRFRTKAPLVGISMLMMIVSVFLTPGDVFPMKLVTFLQDGLVATPIAVLFKWKTRRAG